MPVKPLFRPDKTISEFSAAWDLYSGNISNGLRIRGRQNHNMLIANNPYKKRLYAPDTPQTARRKKARALMANGTCPEINPYTWTMGYNNCVGRCTGGREYGKFSGSSFNRWRHLKRNWNAQDLEAVTKHLVTMAAAKAGRMRQKYGELPPPLFTLIERQDLESRNGYRDWIFAKVGGDGLSSSFGVHILSSRSRGKIKDKATAFYRSCPGSRTFATLTFISAVDDDTAVSILNKFLTVLRKRLTNVQFLWVAERQTHNEKYPNNIHFHIIFNKRLPVKEYNGLWVLQQYNAGLVGETKYGEPISKAEIDGRYAEGTIQKVLNPFDIKKIFGINGLSNYLTKYITKQEKDVPFGCAVWHCSRKVSRMFTRAACAPSAFRYMMSLANSRVDKQTGEIFQTYPIKPEEGAAIFYTMIYAVNKSAPLPYLREMEQINKWILEGLVPDKLPELDDDSYREQFVREDGIYNDVLWVQFTK